MAKKSTLQDDLKEVAIEVVEVTLEFLDEEFGLKADERELRESFDAMLTQALSTRESAMALELVMKRAGYTDREIAAAIDGHVDRQMRRSRRNGTA